ncbi:MAG: tetratricopeptide repeat protein [Candidatus Eisenbacteria bacterium]|uniref:Tetratricopeptide repeat protein n=1 Tax=Eiseniibacteriota bacterium TaxID=2212470 RepID=A0A7Y2EEG5_UNCEI|nr:tetratricopeptide repeat protein [Candidatus Eisenbacteria bacterium]
MRLLLRLSLLGVMLFVTGCGAYFNTFYHARKFYGEAQKIEQEAKENPRPGQATNTRHHEPYSKSIEKCKKVLANHPDSRYADDAQFLMAQAYYGKSDYMAAKRELNRFKVKFPSSDLLADVYFWEGLVSLGAEDYADARGAWNRLLEDYPDYENREEVHFYLADVLRREGSLSEASEAYNNFVTEYPKHPRASEARLNLGDILLEEKRYEEAQEVFTYVMEKSRKSEERFQAQLNLGEAFERAGNPKEALELYLDLALEIDPNLLDGRLTAEEREERLEAERALRAASLQDSLFAARFNERQVDENGNPIPGSGQNEDELSQEELEEEQRRNELQVPGGDPNFNNPNNPNNPNNLNNQNNNRNQNNQQVTRRASSPLPTDPKYLDLARVMIREGRARAIGENPLEAILTYEQVIAEYPRTEHAAEAQFRIGYTYEVYLDDLESAEKAYNLVSSHGRSSFGEEARQRAQNLSTVKQVTASLSDSTSTADQKEADARFLRAELYLFQQEKPEKAIQEYTAIQQEFQGTDQEAKAALAEAWTRFHVQADSARGRAKYLEVMNRFGDTHYGRNAQRFLKGPEREPRDDEFYGPLLDDLLTPENLASVSARDSTLLASRNPIGAPPRENPTRDIETPGGLPIQQESQNQTPVDPANRTVDPFAIPELDPDSPIVPSLYQEVVVEQDEKQGLDAIEGLSPAEAQAVLDSLMRSVNGEPNLDSMMVPPALLDTMRFVLPDSTLNTPSGSDSLKAPTPEGTSAAPDTSKAEEK